MFMPSLIQSCRNTWAPTNTSMIHAVNEMTDKLVIRHNNNQADSTSNCFRDRAYLIGTTDKYSHPNTSTGVITNPTLFSNSFLLLNRSRNKESVDILSHTKSQASYQIRKIAGCACTGNAENVFPATDYKGNHCDSGMHHGTCVTHVPWCMSWSLTRGGKENVPGIPGACATRSFTYLHRTGFVLQARYIMSYFRLK